MPPDPASRNPAGRGRATLIAAQLAGLFGTSARVALQGEQAWASAVFAGTRYRFAVEWTPLAKAAKRASLAKALPDHEFDLTGHFVADLVVREQSDDRWLIEILALVDPVRNERDAVSAGPSSARACQGQP
ncbi:hypothetical protein [Parasphingorhabdus sp.]|uniref:hypothetical protein n=1 Tax=Parasphingorhabdus sp. TaxID=2709688 RepID=UPI003001ECCA